MNSLKKVFALFFIFIILVTGCAKAPVENQGTATVSPLHTQGISDTTPNASDTSSTSGAINNTDAPADAVTNTPATAPAGATGTLPAGATPTPTPASKPSSTPSITLPQIKISNILSLNTSSFDSVSSVNDTGWGSLGATTLSVSDDGYDGKCLKFTVSTSFSSAMLDISKYIKTSGTYTVSFKYMIESTEDYVERPFQLVLRGAGETSFMKRQPDNNIYLGLSYPEEGDVGDWLEAEASFDVSASDIGKGAPWDFGVHLIADSVKAIYIDDVCVGIAEYVYTDTAYNVTQAQTWVATDAVFISSKKYSRPFYDVDLDLILTNGNVTYTVPCFWDGGSVWRARFMCPTAGTWTYKTVCSDKTNPGLHNQTSTINVTQYNGTLDIYKRGFVKTQTNVKYFTYNDGTPFFYIGDTHWNLSSEPLSNIKEIVNKRVQQNYTVIQSEPLGARFDFTDGITEDDIYELRENDQKFKYIADKGLVHANASFFFPSSMTAFINNYGGFNGKVMGQATNAGGTFTHRDLSDTAKKELERICRYWVARYSAFPVMWTLGQEVDRDFYFVRNNYDNGWSYINSPYKYMATYLNQHDPYKAPLTAHQEATYYTNASQSAFRDIAAHTWYGAQWSPDLTGASIASTAMEYWNNSQGKPVINYEGRYCYLWTKNFGARAQGWMAYLSGMFGYGWGGHDTWSYLNTYNEDASSFDGVDTITPQEKQAATWRDSMEYPSSYQVGYMRTFFEKTVGDWYNLIPRFDDTRYLQRQSGAYAVIASNSANTKIVAYFYNFSDTSVGATPNSRNGGTNTGTFGNLTPNVKYNYMWFDPINNKVVTQGTFTADANGKWFAGAKSTCDMVLYIYK